MRKAALQHGAPKAGNHTLRLPEQLPRKFLDHNLSGNYSGYRECLIENDWLLIYREASSELELYRTGTHSALFG